MSSKPDTAVVVTTHHEGRLAIPTFRGLERTMAHAATQGIATEVVVVRDRADLRTRQEVDRVLSEGVLGSASRIEVIDVEHGDLGLSRNAGIAATTAKFVGVLDADNLPSANWLARAHDVLTGANGPAIAHPARIVKFDALLQVWPLVGTDDPRFHRGMLAWFNLWDAFALMHREVAERFPYRECRPGAGFGPEDWAFNCDTVAAEIPHLIAPGTSLYYQAKYGESLAQLHSGSLLPRNALLRSKEVAAEEIARLGGQFGMETLEPGPSSLARRATGALRRRSSKVDATVRVAGRVVRRVRSSWREDAGTAWSLPLHLAELTGEERADWREAHRLQPRLLTPVIENLARYDVVGEDYDNQMVPDRLAYWRMIDVLPGEVDFVCVAPWVRTGGGDRQTLEHLRGVRRLRPDATVALITTASEESEHLDEVPDGVVVAELGRMGLWPQFTEQVLAMVCAQLQPATIHINNSAAGYWIVERFGAALAAHSLIYLQTFCVERGEDGSDWSFLYNRARDYFEPVTGILTDSQAFVDDAVTVQGIPRELFTVMTVVDTAGLDAGRRARSTRSSGRPLRLLWAGRFDPQKRLDRLADISTVLAERDAPVEIVVKGRPVLSEGRQWRNDLDRACAGVAIEGEPYSGGFLNAHPEDFDALLLTSDYEGIAMVVLEAMAAGLPVIAPLVGGMAEMIDEEVAYPIDPASGVEGYLDAIALLAADPDLAHDRAERARARVVGRASREVFDATLESLPGYLPRPGRGLGAARTPARYFASPETAKALEEGAADVIVYSGSNGHSNFGDILQNKNVLAYWAGRAGRTTTLIMPLQAASPEGRATAIERWYPSDRLVFVGTDATLARGLDLVEVRPQPTGSLMHVVGGGYLNSMWGHEHFEMIEALAESFGVPVLFSGLQIDRAALDGFRGIARSQRITHLGLRDQESYQLAREELPGLPTLFTFDDLTEILLDWARGAQDHVRAAGPARVAIHMNTSGYAGGDASLQLWLGILNQVATIHPGCEVLLLHAYADPRAEVRDTLDTVCALAEDMPFVRFEALDISKASLEYRFGEGLPAALSPVLDADMVVSSSYHTALFGALLGRPAYLVATSEYVRQKARLFALPSLEVFLRDPQAYVLDISEELAARRTWLDLLAEQPAPPEVS